jgi:hypothetical protein
MENLYPTKFVSHLVIVLKEKNSLEYKHTTLLKYLAQSLGYDNYGKLSRDLTDIEKYPPDGVAPQLQGAITVDSSLPQRVGISTNDWIDTIIQAADPKFLNEYRILISGHDSRLWDRLTSNQAYQINDTPEYNSVQLQASLQQQAVIAAALENRAVILITGDIETEAQKLFSFLKAQDQNKAYPDELKIVRTADDIHELLHAMLDDNPSVWALPVDTYAQAFDYLYDNAADGDKSMFAPVEPDLIINIPRTSEEQQREYEIVIGRIAAGARVFPQQKFGDGVSLMDNHWDSARKVRNIKHQNPHIPLTPAAEEIYNLLFGSDCTIFIAPLSTVENGSKPYDPADFDGWLKAILASNETHPWSKAKNLYQLYHIQAQKYDRGDFGREERERIDHIVETEGQKLITQIKPYVDAWKTLIAVSTAHDLKEISACPDSLAAKVIAQVMTILTTYLGNELTLDDVISAVGVISRSPLLLIHDALEQKTHFTQVVKNRLKDRIRSIEQKNGADEAALRSFDAPPESKRSNRDIYQLFAAVMASKGKKWWQRGYEYSAHIPESHITYRIKADQGNIVVDFDDGQGISGKVRLDPLEDPFFSNLPFNPSEDAEKAAKLTALWDAIIEHTSERAKVVYGMRY